MTTQIVPVPNMTMVIKRLGDFTVKRLSGIDNIPHLCIKVRHGDGFGWFGVNILNVTDTSPWSAETAQIIETKFMEAMRKIVDMKEMITDVSRLMDSIQDITIGRRRPIYFGGQSNEKLQITGMNNIQIEVYQDAVKKESLTYGGHFFELTTQSVDPDTDDIKQALFVYHRGIILYNYSDADEIATYVEEELVRCFPEIYVPGHFELRYISEIERNRSKLMAGNQREGN